MKKNFLIFLFCIHSICFGNENLPKVNEGTLWTKINERNNLSFCLVHKGLMEEIYEVEFAKDWKSYNYLENLVYIILQEFECTRCNKLLLLDFKNGIKKELAENVESYCLFKNGIMYYITSPKSKIFFSLFQYNIRDDVSKSLEIDIEKYIPDNGTFYGIDFRFESNFLWLYFYADACEVMKIQISADEKFSIQNVYVASYDENRQQNFYQYENGKREYINDIVVAE